MHVSDSKVKDIAAPRSLAGRRIIFLLANFLLGGAERQALILAHQLVESEGAEVQVWSLGGAGPAIRIAEEFGLAHRCLRLQWRSSRFGFLCLLASLASRLAAARPDAILSYLVVPNTLIGTVWRLTGAKVAVWNQRDVGLARVGGRIERWAVRNTPLFISNSFSGAQFLINALDAPPERVQVVHNGVAVNQPRCTREENRSRFGIGQKAFAVCMLANLTEHKDHTTLLKAWRAIADHVSSDATPVQLLLAGAFGSTYQKLSALVQALGLQHSVRFLGFVEDVRELLSAVDLYVHSSHSEGCPNGLLEAMSSGLPVIATDIPSIRDVLGPHSFEYLFKPADEVALARAVLRVMGDRELCHKMGAINRQRVAEEFSVEQLGRKTADLLRPYLAR